MKAQHIISTETLKGAGPPGVFIPQGVIDRRGIRATSRATDQLARSLFDFGQHMQTEARRDMASHQYALAQRDVADAELAARRDPDHRSIPGKFSQGLDDIQASHADQIFDPVARNMFSRKFIEYRVPRERQMKFYSWEREGEAQRAHVIEELDIKARSIADAGIDDPVQYKIGVHEGIDSINQRVAGGWIDEDVGARNRVAWLKDTANLRAATAVKREPVNARDKLQAKGWKETFPFLTNLERQGYIDGANRRIAQVERAADTERKHAEAEQKKLKAGKREAARRDIVKKINFPSQAGKINPWNDIQNNPDLESKDIEHFLNVVKKNAEAALKGKKSIYEETDVAWASELKEQIYRDHTSIKDADEIWKWHGKGKDDKGLSTTKAEELVKLWEDRSKPGKENMVTSLKLAIKTLGDMKKNGVFGDAETDDLDVIFERDAKHSEYVTNMEIFAAENPKATDKEFRDKLREMTTDDQKRSFWNEATMFLEQFPHRFADIFGLSGESFELLNLEKKPLDPKRLKAVETLRKAGKPTTEANIKYMMENQ